MRNRTYTKKLINAVEVPDAQGIGTELGRVCIEYKYSIMEVAEVLNVSRQTVYNWIFGRSKPSAGRSTRIQALIDKIKQQPLRADE